MIIAKTLEEIELMREAALVVSRTLGMLASEVKNIHAILALCNHPLDALNLPLDTTKASDLIFVTRMLHGYKKLGTK